MYIVYYTVCILFVCVYYSAFEVTNLHVPGAIIILHFSISSLIELHMYSKYYMYSTVIYMYYT